MTDVAELLEEVERLTQPGRVLSHADLNTAYRICAAGLSVQRAKVFHFFQGNQYFPIMSSYMSDGWSVFVNETRTETMPGKTTVVRRGRFKHEFVIERSILRTLRPCGGGT